MRREAGRGRWRCVAVMRGRSGRAVASGRGTVLHVGYGRGSVHSRRWNCTKNTFKINKRSLICQKHQHNPVALPIGRVS